MNEWRSPTNPENLKAQSSSGQKGTNVFGKKKKKTGIVYTNSRIIRILSTPCTQSSHLLCPFSAFTSEAACSSKQKYCGKRMLQRGLAQSMDDY